MKRAVLGLALVACYREGGSIGAPNEPEPGAAPMVMQTAAAKCGADDLAQPVVDVNPGGRLRSHRNGPLTTAGTWVGPAVPPVVPNNIVGTNAQGGTLELFSA